MKTRAFTLACFVGGISLAVYGDIPAPKDAPPTIDWSFVLMGVICAFLGGLLFVWLGRKLFKRPQ